MIISPLGSISTSLIFSYWSTWSYLPASLLNWINYLYIFPSTSIFIDITLKSLDLMLLLSHDCSSFCYNNIGFDHTISKNNLLFPSSSLRREDKLVSKIQNPLLMPLLKFISKIRDITKHKLRMTLQYIFNVWQILVLLLILLLSAFFR